MSVKYEDALKLWGADKLIKQNNPKKDIDLDSVVVWMDFNEGYACCGGSDPNCYCSFAESPSARVHIKGHTVNGKYLTAFIDFSDFDFATVLNEMIELAGGAITK